MKKNLEMLVEFILPIIQLIAPLLILDLFHAWHKSKEISGYDAYRQSGWCLAIIYIICFFIVFKIVKKNYYIYLLIQIFILIVYLFIHGMDTYLLVN